MDEATRRTLKSFGYEWTTFSRIEPEDEIFWRRYFRDVPLGELGESVTLDVGCGKGRFAYFTAPHVKHLMALDGSAAIEAAAGNLAGLPNVSLWRADVRRLPLRDRTVGFVYCLGVLHHLTHPRAGFDELARVLAPGGRLLLYVYSRPDRFNLRDLGLRAATGLRHVTTKLPHPLLRIVCMPIALLLYGAFVIPGRFGQKHGRTVLASFPLQTYRGRPLRSLWLDTFDRLSAPIEHRYLWSEIAPWFDESGLSVDAVRDDAGLFVLARREQSPVQGDEAST